MSRVEQDNVATISSFQETDWILSKGKIRPQRPREL